MNVIYPSQSFKNKKYLPDYLNTNNKLFAFVHASVDNYISLIRGLIGYISCEKRKSEIL